MAWDGKGPRFESDQELFFFQTGNIQFQKKLSASYLSAYLISAELSHLGIFFSMLIF